jgi:hypothetical protein
MALHFVYSDLSMKSKAAMMVKPATTVMKVLNNWTQKNAVNLA